MKGLQFAGICQTMRVLAYAVAGVLPLSLVAQATPDNTLPQELRNILPQSPTPAVTDASAKSDLAPEKQPAKNPLITEQLEGILLLSNDEQVTYDGIDALPENNRLDTSALTLPPSAESLAERLQPFLHKRVDMKVVSKIRREIILFYREAGRPVVHVRLPEQAVRNGILQLVVVESRLGSLQMEGANYFSEATILRPVSLQPGDPIDTNLLHDDIAWINRNPFRRVEPIYATGDLPGTTDVIVRVEDRYPLRVFGGYNDTGNKLTEYDRYYLGFNWGDAFGLDHQLNYQLTLSSVSRYLTAHSLSYVIPLPESRDTLTLIASYADTGADVTPTVSVSGISWSLSARYALSLPKLKENNQGLTFGFDFKRSDTTLLLGGNPLVANTPDIFQGLIAYTYSMPDFYEGFTSLGSTLFFSPGGITSENDDRDFAPGDSRYVYARLNASHIRPIFEKFTLNLAAEAQLASTDLYASEQMGAGGAFSVRGYDNREASGDTGLRFSAELRSPPKSLATYAKTDLIQDDSLQWLLFFDYAQVSRRNDRDPHSTLMSIGPGLRYQVAEWLTGRFDYGFQLHDSGIAAANRDTSNRRGHISLEVSF